jgi:hyperosmotically inducible protein
LLLITEQQTKNMKRTLVKPRETLILAVVSALMLAGSSLRAFETHDRNESSAKKSNVLRHYLSDDAIKTEFKNGVVTLTGTAAEESYISLAL